MFLADGKAEVAEVWAEREIFAVNEGDQSGLVEAEFSFGVDQLFRYLDGDDFGDEHNVRTEVYCPGDAAFDIDRTFESHRAFDFQSGCRRQPGFFKLVVLAARDDAAPVGYLGLFSCGNIYDKLAGLPDDVIGIAFGPDGDRKHRRVGADRSGPGDGD